MAKLRRVRSVLVVDDDEDYLAQCVRELAPRRVSTTTKGELAVGIAQREKPDLALVDLWLDDPAPPVRGERAGRRRYDWGIDTIADLRSYHRELVIVLVTGSFSRAYDRVARDAGANSAVCKGIADPATIVAMVERGMLPEMPRDPDHETIARNEHEHIAKAFVANDRRVGATADALDISRTVLWRKLRAPRPPR